MSKKIKKILFKSLKFTWQSLFLFAERVLQRTFRKFVITLCSYGGIVMMNLDLSPFYRSSVGFDRLASMLDSTLKSDAGNGYPPYNIEVIDDNKYEITLAVSGFSESELNLHVENNILTVSGKKDEVDNERRFIHKGIAARAFERKFTLADYVEVTDARLKDGLLVISMVKEVPEVMKPKKIAINDSSKDNVLEGEVGEKVAA